ncbi:hypothetical protein [Nocardia sp. NPDC057353]|uniref:hypothetical protein n=1 Tax=Nocardia sp. NPDC057353 TaxID=3346104 RepID=UPI00362817C3
MSTSANGDLDGWEIEGMPGEQEIADDGRSFRLGPGGRIARSVAVRPGTGYTLAFEIGTAEPAAAATVSVHGDGEILESRPFPAGAHTLDFTAPGAEVTLRVLADGGALSVRAIALRS